MTSVIKTEEFTAQAVIHNYYTMKNKKLPAIFYFFINFINFQRTLLDKNSTAAIPLRCRN